MLFKKLVPARTRCQLRVFVWLLRNRRDFLWGTLRHVSIKSIGEVLVLFEGFCQADMVEHQVFVRGVDSPIHLRSGTSDFDVFKQVFLLRQYDLPRVENPKHVIDAGANIGLSSVYFLSRYPNANVIAIEPDLENYAVAKMNLKAFGSRCSLIHGALWSHEKELAVHQGEFRDGQHWATQTREIDVSTENQNSGLAFVQAVTVNQLMVTAGFPNIDLLKVDIEGAELEVFRDGDTSFLANTKYCAVECHSQECVQALTNALSQFDFQIEILGELHLAYQQSHAGDQT